MHTVAYERITGGRYAGIVPVMDRDQIGDYLGFRVVIGDHIIGYAPSYNEGDQMMWRYRGRKMRQYFARARRHTSAANTRAARARRIGVKRCNDCGMRGRFPDRYCPRCADWHRRADRDCPW